MRITSDITVRARYLKIVLSDEDLREALLVVILREAGLAPDLVAEMKLVFEQVREGSPSYPTDKWIAKVEAKIKLDE